MRRSSAVLTALLAATLTTALLAAPASSAPALPDIGDTCDAQQFWKEIPVRKVSKDSSSTYTFTVAKDSPKADRFVCVPAGWYPEAGKDIKALVGTWIWERYPLRLKWDPEIYKRDPQHDPCRLKTAGYPRQTFANYDRVAAGFLPTVGEVRGLMVTVAPQDVLDNAFVDSPGVEGSAAERLQRWRADSEALAAYAEDYYWNESRGRLRLTIDVDRELRAVDPSLLPRDWFSLDPTALITALDAGIDFRDVDFVIFQVPRVDRVMAFSARPNPAVVDGERIRNSHGLARDPMVPSDAGDRFTLVHEIGHLFGLPDLYAEANENPDPRRYSLDMSVMHGSAAKGLTGYERWILDWLPTKAVRCVLPGDGYAKSIGMSTVDSNDSYGLKLVMFPVSGTTDRLRAIELRGLGGHTAGFFPGILAYEIFGQSNSARFVGMPDRTAYSDSRAPLTAFREDWSTLDRSSPPGDEAGPNAAVTYLEGLEETIRRAQSQAVRQASEAAALVWDDGQTITLDRLQLRWSTSGTRATLTYGLGN